MRTSRWAKLRTRRMPTRTTTLATSKLRSGNLETRANLRSRQRYSDDDDTSWKVRRSATKLLTACISTRSDLLSTFYQTVSPALISRFGEREETVKVEVWATYTILLGQTKVWGTGSATKEGESTNGRLKRKRSSDQMDVDEG